MTPEWAVGSPRIEEDGSVSVHDMDAKETGYRRLATADETQRAILYWIEDIHNRIGKPGG